MEWLSLNGAKTHLVIIEANGDKWTPCGHHISTVSAPPVTEYRQRKCGYCLGWLEGRQALLDDLHVTLTRRTGRLFRLRGRKAEGASAVAILGMYG